MLRDKCDIITFLLVFLSIYTSSVTLKLSKQNEIPAASPKHCVNSDVLPHDFVTKTRWDRNRVSRFGIVWDLWEVEMEIWFEKIRHALQRHRSSSVDNRRIISSTRT